MHGHYCEQIHATVRRNRIDDQACSSPVQSYIRLCRTGDIAWARTMESRNRPWPHDEDGTDTFSYGRAALWHMHLHHPCTPSKYFCIHVPQEIFFASMYPSKRIYAPPVGGVVKIISHERRIRRRRCRLPLFFLLFSLAFINTACSSIMEFIHTFFPASNPAIPKQPAALPILSHVNIPFTHSPINTYLQDDHVTIQ